MSRKKQRTKSKSARGHVEGNVIRLKLKQELVRVDKNGDPIQDNHIPLNVMSKNWLSNQLLDPSVSGPPKIVTRNPPPDNVTSITKAKKAEVSKPVSQSGNEAEVVQTTNVSGNKHGWLHDKAMAKSEFASWSRITKEIGRERCGSEPWVKTEKGKLSSPSLERQRELSKQGHTKLKFKSPPSTVSNPFIKPDAPHGGYAQNNRAQPISVLNQRNRARYGVAEDTPVSPSGIPISEFVTGKYKPKSSVVSAALPPTASKHWHGDAANAQEYQATNEWARKTHGMVQWFINHVEPQNWPTHVHNFVNWKNDGPVVNTGAINKAAAHPETELILVKSLNEGLEKDWRMLDSALTDAQSANNLLQQELSLTKQELASERQANNLMGYALSHHEGVPPEDVQEYIVKSKPPQVPDDVDSMLFQYRMFKSFERMSSPEEAFARYVYNDPSLGIVMRGHADMLCEQRQAAVQYRNLVRFLKQLSTYLIAQQRVEYEQWWAKEYPKQVRTRNRKHISAVRDPGRESVALAAISRKGKPATERSSKYYSTLHDRSSYLTSAVAKAILQQVQPTRPRYNNPHLVEHDSRQSWAQPQFRGVSKYEQWWAERLDYCEVKYHEIKHPIKVGVVKTYNKLVDLLNTPVDPSTRRKHTHLREQIKQRQRELDEKREYRKEQRLKDKQRKAERAKIREMQRLAH